MMLMASNAFAEDKRPEKPTDRGKKLIRMSMFFGQRVCYTATNGINEIIIEGISGNILTQKLFKLVQQEK